MRSFWKKAGGCCVSNLSEQSLALGAVIAIGLVVGIFLSARCIKKHCKDERLRKTPNEGQIDKMVEDSFPASDPPSTY